MVSAKILGSKKDRIIKTGEEFLEVEIEISDLDSNGLGEVRTVKHSFSIDATPAEIKAEIKKLVKAHKAEKIVMEKQAVEDEKQASADKTIEKLAGVTVK